MTELTESDVDVHLVSLSLLPGQESETENI